MSELPLRVLPLGTRLSACPKPNLPTGEDYRPPSPPSPCDLGPPPPTGNNIIIIFRELLSSGYRCTSQVVFVSTLAVII
ncbi:hypothetical protein FRC03_000991 [Tulasnella sp. 419]|nr:hypothetical protein FRC03_000991 [Tulasnella sp. 419]